MTATLCSVFADDVRKHFKITFKVKSRIVACGDNSIKPFQLLWTIDVNLTGFYCPIANLSMIAGNSTLSFHCILQRHNDREINIVPTNLFCFKLPAIMSPFFGVLNFRILDHWVSFCESSHFFKIIKRHPDILFGKPWVHCHRTSNNLSSKYCFCTSLLSQI